MEKKAGRIFFENECTEELLSNIETTRNLLEKLDNVENVLENASLVAILMHYLANKSQDYNALLFYYVIRKYEKLNETKNTIKNHQHVHMEMYTIFVDPKSILYIPILNLELLEELKDATNLSTYTTVFQKTGNYLIDNIIEPSLDKFKTSISLGIERYAFDQKVDLPLDKKMELSVLESFHETLRTSLVRSQKTRCLPKQQEILKVRNMKDFQIKAIFASLNTQYEYFLKSKKYSFILRSPQFLTSGRIILSILPQYPMKKYKIKGHYFVECNPPNIEICVICDNILWGAYPQGLLCNNCKMSVHRECKEAIKPCLIKKRKSNFNSNEIMVNNHEKETDCIYNTKETNVKTDPNSMDEDHESKEVKNSKKPENVIFSSTNSVSPMPHIDLMTPTKFSYKPMKRLQDFYSPSFDKSSKSSIKSTKSMNNNDCIKSEISKTRAPSPDTFLFPTKRIIEKSKISISDNESNNSSNISVEPLIFDEWEYDEEMKVNETFDPEIELQNFPNQKNISKSKSNSAYSRLLVLMEFHHKTKFIRMILKRFKYLLVDRWQRMGEFLDLFELLSLNCIHELYTLIKSLVETMDKCINEETYDNEIAENVHKWLTDKDDMNLHCWLRLSVDLCCTNILQSIKTNWTEHKRNFPKLNELLSVEFNRLIVIEQLANMRPLLFNLPMIVSKIVKDLKRFPEYEDEASVWEKIQYKLIFLPRFIDERCMPVVVMINNGTIIGSPLRYENTNKESESENRFEKFIVNFPKTIFKETFIDFQLIVISNLRELHLDDSKIMQSTVYIREEIEGAAICYANKMIILQKENDKYLLKKFKSINQQKLFPVISFDKVHVTKQTVKEIKHYSYELTILLIDQAVLVQILFKEEKPRNMWFDHIIKKTKKTITHQESAVSMDYSPIESLINEEKSSHILSTESIIPNLEDASNNLKKALDQVSEGLTTVSQHDNTLKEGAGKTDKTPNEIFSEYLEIIFEYTRLGVQVLEQSQQIDPNTFFRQDIFLLQLHRIKDLNGRMMQITENLEQMPDTEEMKTERLTTETYGTIQQYVEDIIACAKDQVDLDSKEDENSDYTFFHDDSEYKYD